VLLNQIVRRQDLALLQAEASARVLGLVNVSNARWLRLS